MATLDNTTSKKSQANLNWIIIQKNAREHYALPRILSRLNILSLFLTDIWIPASSWIRKLTGPIGASRWHPELANIRVVSITLLFVVWRLFFKYKPGKWWSKIDQEDRWFQHWTAKQLQKRFTDSDPKVLFSFSYTALQSFKLAKKKGWKTVLGQIDPGPIEWNIVDQGIKAYQHLEPPGAHPPPDYWQRWREEVMLADRIIVNSEWSHSLLVKQGVLPEKLITIPLLYDTSPLTLSKLYPEKFTPSRPLRVLFLGRITLRKGIGQLLDAATILLQESVEFRLVGPCAIQCPDHFELPLNISLEGPASGELVTTLYDWADLFILPTLSDGFAITQLEALARRVPVMISKNCAHIVTHCFDGWILSDVTPEIIAHGIKYVLDHPEELASWSTSAKVPDACSMESILKSYQKLSDELESSY